ncbi:MAG: 2-aminoethylphosphonate--pyruvate transaminase [Acetobacteraceae bacterium]|nr:2-aminoethylphosphonate--pyruvate transaminase [Acetobacteraceae bacterium]MBV8590590.1 2-aminoethylphosphonate--pyruvate transaminase [Acetobacteraceae bacterium]
MERDHNRDAGTSTNELSGKHVDRQLLLTPGPLTTSPRTRAAMLRDWGSRDEDFIALTARVRERLLALAGAEQTHAAVLIQGSGTFAIEAMLHTLMPRTGRLLALVNGAYGRRMADIARRLGRDLAVLEAAENCIIGPEQVARILAGDSRISDVALVHCETTTGLLNPAEEIARIVTNEGRRFLLDAMSSFGALPLQPVARLGGSIAASANKCLEGAPGVAFVLAERAWLGHCEGQAQSLSLDLHAQWRFFESSGQWRFTPPTHILAALDAALAQLAEEGGPAERLARYRRNCAALVQGMRKLGFTTYLDDAVQAPIIVTFREPQGGWFDFQHFYRALHSAGIVIYPGKLTNDKSFRIGCIGAIDTSDIAAALEAIAAYVLRHAHRGERIRMGDTLPEKP